MFELNEKIRDLTPYDPITGTYTVRLDANESFLSLPDDVRQELGRIASSLDYRRYPDPLATDVCAAFGAYYGVDPACVAGGNGSDELISILMNAFLQPGDAVITALPDFSMYGFYAHLAGGREVSVPKDDSLRFPTDAVIETAKRENARMIVFSNPCNPTGQGLPKNEVRRLLQAVPETLVVLDEAYMDFWDESMLPEATKYDNLLILRTCSKAFGGAAVRLGFVVGPERLVRAVRAVKSPYNLNSFTQAAGTVLLSRRDAEKAAIETIKASTHALHEALCRLAEAYPVLEKVYDTCCNFVFIRTGAADSLHRGLLQKGIAVRRFPGYLRITAGSEEENQAVTAALQELLAADTEKEGQA